MTLNIGRSKIKLICTKTLVRGELDTNDLPHINYEALARRGLRNETFALSRNVQVARTRKEFSFASEIRRPLSRLPPPPFFLFSFARYAAINFDWRTRGALRSSRFKESRNVRACSPSTRKSQSELAIYGAGYRRASHKFAVQMHANPIISGSERVTARFALRFGDVRAPPRSPRPLLAGDGNSKRTILLWATNYIPNHRGDSSNGPATKLTRAPTYCPVLERIAKRQGGLLFL